MNLRLGGHWLAFLWNISTGAPLTDAVRKARSAGATVFELVYHALNGLSPSKTARALRSGGMSRAIMCVFYPPGDNGECPMGDPLSSDEDLLEKALQTFRRVLDFIVKLRGHGIEINMIVGPSCFVLGQSCPGNWFEKLFRIQRFYKALANDLRAANVKVAIELLRPEEDLVVQTVENWASLIDSLNREIPSVTFGAHFDTFHVDRRGYDQVDSLQALGKRILHLHFNGSDRRPAGADGDAIRWDRIVGQLERLNLGDELVAVNEPFCDVVRKSCPPLGVGLPPAAEEPGGIQKTRETLERNGVEFVS